MDENSIFFAGEVGDLDIDPAALMSSTDFTNERVTLADYIYPAIQKQYIAILTHEADVITDGDVEAVHQMRVSLRRLRSMIQAFAPMLDVPKVMGNKSIGKIAKILGKVRDLDILQENCKTYLVNSPNSERSTLEEVVIKMAKRRRKAMLRVQLMLNEKEYQYFKLGLNNWLNHPQYTQTINVPIDAILPDLILASIGKLFLNPGWWIDPDLDSAIDPEKAVAEMLLIHGNVFHTLRKQVKAIRYLMELFTDRYDVRYHDHLRDLKQIHQILGNIQDRTILDNFMQRFLGKRAATKLPNMYAEIAHENYLNWQDWQKIQNRYRSIETRKEIQLLPIQGKIHNS